MLTPDQITSLQVLWFALGPELGFLLLLFCPSSPLPSLVFPSFLPFVKCVILTQFPKFFKNSTKCFYTPSLRLIVKIYSCSLSLALTLTLCHLYYTTHVILCGTVQVSLCGTANCVFPNGKNTSLHNHSIIIKIEELPLIHIQSFQLSQYFPLQ